MEAEARQLQQVITQLKQHQEQEQSPEGPGLTFGEDEQNSLRGELVALQQAQKLEMHELERQLLVTSQEAEQLGQQWEAEREGLVADLARCQGERDQTAQTLSEQQASLAVLGACNQKWVYFAPSVSTK